MRRIAVQFGRFWFDFLVGDDWLVPVGIVLALSLSAILARTSVPAWWVLPLAVVGLLVQSVVRARRRQEL